VRELKIKGKFEVDIDSRKEIEQAVKLAGEIFEEALERIQKKTMKEPIKGLEKILGGGSKRKKKKRRKR